MKKISENKTVIYIVILVILIGIGLFFKYKKDDPAPLSAPSEEVIISDTISIDSKEIREENFSGKVSVVEGKSELAIKAQSYIDQSVAEFKKQADIDVPAMREQFGDDAASSQYEIIIDAKYTKSEGTESIVLLQYSYTGGAHGNSSYNVITASSGGNILSLSDMIKKERESDFASLVKKELLAWRPDETIDSSPVFTEDVQALKFNSFKNWSLDDKNFTLYFSQYEIGPGVLGPVAFPLSIEKIKDFLK